ncbi:MAG: acetyltransferase [Pedobacter sp.]|nr:MAG: acetyltransferase [Pedobacter sp.]
MTDVAIVGAGGFGREVKMLIDQINAVQQQFNFLGYFDDGIEKGTLINNYPVLGGISAINELEAPTAIAVAIGLPSLKKKLIEQITSPLITYPTLIHPSVIIGDDFVTIGEGTIICAQNVITVNIEIGKYVIINLACTIGHDTQIGDFCSLMPSVNVSGEVQLHEGVYIGTGVKVINQLSVGTGTIIGAGAVVSKSLPDNCTAVGIPAKPIKFHHAE